MDTTSTLARPTVTMALFRDLLGAADAMLLWVRPATMLEVATGGLPSSARDALEQGILAEAMGHDEARELLDAAGGDVKAAAAMATAIVRRQLVAGIL